MKRLLLALSAVFLTSAFVFNDAEARRLGGGKPAGVQRAAPDARPAAPPAAQQAAPAAAARTALPVSASPICSAITWGRS